MSDLRYPIGPFESRTELSPEERRTMIEQIAETPARMRAAVFGLNAGQLDTPYRDGGWTVRQVVHHVPDSHMNAYIRCKLCVAEDRPRVTAYDQDVWSKFEDVRGPVEISLTIVEALHDRWVTFLRSLPESAFVRTLDHPEDGTVTLARVVFLYDWHGRHHTAQITSLRRRKGWK